MLAPTVAAPVSIDRGCGACPGVGPEGALIVPFMPEPLFVPPLVLDRFGAGVEALLGGCPVPDMSAITLLCYPGGSKAEGMS